LPTIIFIEPDGTEKKVGARIGQTVMEAAVQNGVKGIDADCGGSCSCATCHGYVDEAWQEKLEPADSMELDMLDFAYQRSEGSRLTCQLVVGEGMDGLMIKLPVSQA